MLLKRLLHIAILNLMLLAAPVALFAQTYQMNQPPVQNTVKTPAPITTKNIAPPKTVAPIESLAATSTNEAAADVEGNREKPKSPTVFLYVLILIILIVLAVWLRKKKTCGRCGDKKTITEEYAETVKCSHCGGSGQDPCHYCGGTGKMSLPNPPQSEEELGGWPSCDFCGGSGKKRLGAGKDWGEANDAMARGFACCMCGGKKTETIKRTREIPCPSCK